MKYKGYELLKAIADGEIKEGSLILFDSIIWIVDEYSDIVKYQEEHITLFNTYKAKEIAMSDFELIEDKIDIDSIKHKELEILQEILGQCDLFKGNEKYILKVINENNSRLVDAILKVSKENETLLQAVKQLNKKVKELKEDK
jgi:hypothetical protein|nr:MAG TPA: hypothetical protein [Siphoviridae sp. ctvzh6]